MSNGQGQTTLGEIADFTNGGAWKQTEYSNEGVPVVRVTDIKGETVDLSDCRYLPESSLARYSKHLLEVGDLVVCTVGSHPTQPSSVVGRAAVMPQIAHGALLNQNAVRIRSALPDVDQVWLGYLGRSKPFHDYIISCARGAANQVRMAIGLLKEMPVELPPLPVQCRIAGILSAYDELIENSQRRIRILEAMVRAFYREWFFHFRFPGHENHPRVPSPLGEIPEGWEVKTVADSFEISGGGTPSRKEGKYWDGGAIQWFSPSDLTGAGTMFMDDSSDHITELGLSKSSARLFPARSVMLTSRATIGAIAINTHEACTNQGFITCLPNERVSLFFLHQWLTENVPTFQHMASGATFKEISRGVFKTIEFLQPPAKLVRRFEDVARPMAEQALAHQRQVQILRHTRDLLLPRLLSGQLELEAV
jgi:type I restriction enzyme, S subunit